MKVSISTLGCALLAMAQVGTAHMILAEPKPYGNPSNSPLNKDGSDYPCKNVPYTFDGKPTAWVSGGPASFKWSGSAVHSGGSCLVTLTTDKEPSKESKFHIVYAVEGGCPGVLNGPESFPFTLPKEVPSGDYTAAVAWYNKIGNRELYINCAPVTVSGGGDDAGKFEKLPLMPIANINVREGSTCDAPENADYIFPNPGKNSIRIGAGPFKPLCGGDEVPGTPNSPNQTPAAPPAAPTQNDGQYTPLASQTPPAQATPPVSQAPSPHAPEATPSQKSAITSTVRTLITITKTGTAPASRTPAASPTAAPQAPGGGADMAGPSGETTTCSKNGELLCNGEAHFGLCANGRVIWQPMAAGTKCQNGAIVKRDYTPRGKRYW